MSSRGDRPCARVGTAGRARLGHVAGPSAGSTVPVDHHAVQVPLVASLFVADGQLGRPLLRRDPLVDRRAGTGIGVGARGTVCRRRRSHDPGYVRGDLRARLENADASSAFTRRTASRSWAAVPRSSCEVRSERSMPRPIDTRSSRSAVALSRTPSRAARARSSSRPTATSTSKPPATSSTASRAASAPMPTSRKATVRPRSPTWRISRWPLASGLTGTPRPSDSPIAKRPTSSCTTSIASRGAWREEIGKPRGPACG